jgi:hypothetical protein
MSKTGLSLAVCALACSLPLLLSSCSGVAIDDSEQVGEVQQALRSYQVDVLVMRDLATCAVGDPCTGGACYDFQNATTGQSQVEFEANANFAIVRPDDPRVSSAAQVLCLNLRIEPFEVSEIRAQLDAASAYVLAQTNGDLALNFVVHEVPLTQMTMQPIVEALGTAMTPLDVKLAGILDGRLSANTDFILGMHNAGDFTRNIRVPLGGCGLAFGYQPPMAGAPYAWIPKSGRAFGFECTNRDEALVHEWLHLVDIALDEVSGFNDIYRNGLPANCVPDPDPRRWFPSSDDCSSDPDFEACGGACPGNEPYNRHILNDHWDPARPFFANYCKNGRQDSQPPFDEVGIDQGPSCLASAGTPVARCRDVVVDAGSSCTASVNASAVNNGSFDPDGGSVSCVLSPTGPFGVGTRAVTLRCTDNEGETASCNANIHVGVGNNQNCCPAGTRRLIGTSGNDRLTGTTQNDCILGLGGNDIIDGRGGNDFISAGTGNDTVVGGFGNDFITCGPGDDTVDAGPDHDKIGGDSGRDTITAGPGDDVTSGGADVDTCFVPPGNDIVLMCEI